MTAAQLDLVFAKAVQSWFPVDPALLQSVQEKLHSGAYGQSTSALIEDLKKDVSLFTFCLKEISHRAREGGMTEIDPGEALRNTSLEDLKEIIERQPSDFSSHTMDQMHSAQVVQFQQSVVSASVAETLATKFRVDRDTAYACGLMRQLGLTLIAWNYPNVYRSLSANLTPNDDVDELLSKTLGFSPSSLGLAIARRWGMSSAVLHALGDNTQSLSSREAFIGEALDRICLIGETLARAQDPKNYPNARMDWSHAIDEIMSKLGPGGIEAIKRRIIENSQQYVRYAPELFSWDIKFDSKRLERRSEIRDIVGQNVYIKHCQPEVRRLLNDFYRNLDQSTISRESIVKLTKQVIPSAGFEGGVVYLIEPDSHSLVPRLTIGDVLMVDVAPVSCSVTNGVDNPIAASYRINSPITGEERTKSGKPSYYISGVIGELQRAGVLILRWSEPSNSNRLFKPQILFKALRVAMADCLNLR